jgi:hypothetical protein
MISRWSPQADADASSTTTAALDRRTSRGNLNKGAIMLGFSALLRRFCRQGSALCGRPIPGAGRRGRRADYRPGDSARQ